MEFGLFIAEKSGSSLSSDHQCQDLTPAYLIFLRVPRREEVGETLASPEQKILPFFLSFSVRLNRYSFLDILCVLYLFLVDFFLSAFIAMDANAEPSEYVTLASNDGFEFVISRTAACISGTIRRMLDPKSLYPFSWTRVACVYLVPSMCGLTIAYAQATSSKPGPGGAFLKT